MRINAAAGDMEAGRLEIATTKWRYFQVTKETLTNVEWWPMAAVII